MMNTQVLIHLPEELAARFRQAIPARSRSDFLRSLLEKNLPDTQELMYQAALQAQQFDDAHPEEQDTLALASMDGLDPHETFDLSKLQALCQK
jgi:hypothetical protein